MDTKTRKKKIGVDKWFYAHGHFTLKRWALGFRWTTDIWSFHVYLGPWLISIEAPLATDW